MDIVHLNYCNELHYVGTTPWHLGTVSLTIKKQDNNHQEYIKIIVRNTMFGMTWNTISFIVTYDEFHQMINDRCECMMVTADINNSTIHHIDSVETVVTNGVIKLFDITYSDYNTNSFFYNLFQFDMKKITGINFTLQDTNSPKNHGKVLSYEQYVIRNARKNAISY
jgi:hypothetical protein